MEIQTVASYPEEFRTAPGEGYVPGDYPALLASYGKYSVVLGRFGEALIGFVTHTAVVKLGILGRCTKPVSAESALRYLFTTDHPLFAGRSKILVCTPPLLGDHAWALAKMASAEDMLLGLKLGEFEALDAVAALSEYRAHSLVGDIRCRLDVARACYEAGASKAKPPTGTLECYTNTGQIISMDKLTARIKEFATRPSPTYPPLPPADPAEVDALIHIHDILANNGLTRLAGCLIINALLVPAFAHCCHRGEFFDPGRVPRIGAWFGSPLKLLLQEELSHATRRSASSNPEEVARDAPFILTIDEIIDMGIPHSPESADHAFDRLNTYVGGYLAELDLSHTLITGSAIAAALIITDVENKFTNVGGWADRDKYLAIGYEMYLATHYPPVKTIPRNRGAYLEVAQAFKNGALVNPETSEDDDGLILTLVATTSTGAHLTAVLDVQPGADLDMAIDVASDEEFDTVAHGHYAVIHKRHPAAVLKKVARGSPDKPSYAWTITCERPDTIMFRPVEMYRANFTHVVTHHVGMVSGAYTAALGGGRPEFVVSARLASSMAYLASPNYYYFASRKYAPQHIIMKYYARGFGLSAFPPDLISLMHKTLSTDPVWSGDDSGSFTYPALNGKGFFSAYSLSTELRLLRADIGSPR